MGKYVNKIFKVTKKKEKKNNHKIDIWMTLKTGAKPVEGSPPRGQRHPACTALKPGAEPVGSLPLQGQRRYTDLAQQGQYEVPSLRSLCIFKQNKTIAASCFCG